MASIKCAHCKKTHSSVAQVRECSIRESSESARAELVDQGLISAQASQSTVLFSDPYAVPQSRLIDRMATPPLPPTPRREVVEGMYKVGDRIYKVQKAVHGSGHPYAKELVRPDDGSDTFRFEYAPGAVRVLGPNDRMSIEDATAFGKLYGVCCVCGRTLTNEESIELGIGPICGKREWKW